MLSEDIERRDMSSLETMLKYSELSDEDRLALLKIIEDRKKAEEKKRHPYAGLKMRTGLDAIRYPRLPLDSEIIRARREAHDSGNSTAYITFEEDLAKSYRLPERSRRRLEDIIEQDDKAQFQKREADHAKRIWELREKPRIQKLREEMMPDAKRWMLDPDREIKPCPKKGKHEISSLPKKKDLENMSTDALITYAVDHFDELSSYEMGILDEHRYRKGMWEAQQKIPDRKKYNDLVDVKNLCWSELLKAKKEHTGEKIGDGYDRTASKVATGIFAGAISIIPLAFIIFVVGVGIVLPLVAGVANIGDHIVNAEKYQEEYDRENAERLAREEQRKQEELGDPEDWEQRAAEEAPAQTLPETSPREVGPGTDYYIKGNISSDGERIYHMPGDVYYDETVINESKGERWFSSPEEAEAAGWRKAYV